jgi:hypothetical protein
MPAPGEAVLIDLREWLVKAVNDLTAAGQILKLGKVAPMEPWYKPVLSDLSAVSCHGRCVAPFARMSATFQRPTFFA